MELKWLEDFVSLAETRSFSRSAELRHITQPAFSRRIQALEAWLGTDLIDRSVYPTRLTQAGQVFYEQALAMLSQFHEARTLLRGQTGVPDAYSATHGNASGGTYSVSLTPLADNSWVVMGALDDHGSTTGVGSGTTQRAIDGENAEAGNQIFFWIGSVEELIHVIAMLDGGNVEGFLLVAAQDFHLQDLIEAVKIESR